MTFYQMYVQILDKNRGGIRVIQTLKNEIKKRVKVCKDLWDRCLRPTSITHGKIETIR